MIGRNGLPRSHSASLVTHRTAMRQTLNRPVTLQALGAYETVFAGDDANLADPPLMLRPPSTTRV